MRCVEFPLAPSAFRNSLATNVVDNFEPALSPPPCHRERTTDEFVCSYNETSRACRRGGGGRRERRSRVVINSRASRRNRAESRAGVTQAGATECPNPAMRNARARHSVCAPREIKRPMFDDLTRPTAGVRSTWRVDKFICRWRRNARARRAHDRREIRGVVTKYFPTSGRMINATKARNVAAFAPSASLLTSDRFARRRRRRRSANNANNLSFPFSRRRVQTLVLSNAGPGKRELESSTLVLSLRELGPRPRIPPRLFVAFCPGCGANKRSLLFLRVRVLADARRTDAIN